MDLNLNAWCCDSLTYISWIMVSFDPKEVFWVTRVIHPQKLYIKTLHVLLVCEIMFWGLWFCGQSHKVQRHNVTAMIYAVTWIFLARLQYSAKAAKSNCNWYFHENVYINFASRLFVFCFVFLGLIYFSHQGSCPSRCLGVQFDCIWTTVYFEVQTMLTSFYSVVTYINTNTLWVS